MGSNEISLSFVNKGKSFVIPTMTVGLQEELLEEMAKLEKEKLEKDVIDRKVNKILVMKILQKIDPSVSMENVNNMHPDDYLIISNQLWTKGKEIKGNVQDFLNPKREK